EAQLDRGGDLVDVLPTGTGCAHEALDQYGFRDRDAFGFEHPRIVASARQGDGNNASALANSASGGASASIRRPSRGCSNDSRRACSSLRRMPSMRNARLWRPSPWLVSPIR